jgi:hypothetical protein
MGTQYRRKTMKNIQISDEELPVLQIALLATIEKWQDFDQEPEFWPEKIEILRSIYSKTMQKDLFD